MLVDGWEEAVGSSGGGVLSKNIFLSFIIFSTKIFASSFFFPFDLAFFIKKLFFLLAVLINKIQRQLLH